ncbi:SirB family protein [Cellvibrio zantedeschiae]|uniref:SirB family protein n=1 Tax=Cellvibrio zantedeschiae TaxID=1237077 RepID=A0ABQ3AUH4_9GAMM|nr:SirB2 family protein [Cellvibrio zantedeschiae]GGY68184.1 SirB family protein [Cellvibrio zantedeschiae]
MYEILKHTHLTAILLSFILFFVRGNLMMRSPSKASHKIFLIAPHIVNLILIVSGISLAVTLHLNPADQPWLAVKLVALIVYIALGVLTFKHPKLQVRKVLWVVSLLVFAFIASIAESKNPLGFFAALF